MSYETAFQKVKDNLLQLSAVKAKVCFKFEDDRGIYLDASQTPANLEELKDQQCDCTLKLKADDFVKLADGAMDPVFAFTLGKIKVEGSMGIAMKFSSLLGD